MCVCVRSQSLLEHFEESVSEADQGQNPELDQEADYESRDHEPGRGWNLDLVRDQDPAPSGRSEIHSPAWAQRNHLQDLLMSLRKRASSCFGARMDRIGNASGLGCNSGRGEEPQEGGQKVVCTRPSWGFRTGRWMR